MSQDRRGSFMINVAPLHEALDDCISVATESTSADVTDDYISSTVDDINSNLDAIPEDSARKKWQKIRTNGRPETSKWDQLRNEINADIKVMLNICGRKFITTKKILQRYPKSRLAQLTKDLIRPGPELFFSADEEIFVEILYLYRTGEIHFPKHICVNKIKSELKFWKIPLDVLDDCCSLNDRTEKILEKEFQRFERRIIPDSSWSKIMMNRFHLWCIMTDPGGVYTYYKKTSIAWSFACALAILVQLYIVALYTTVPLSEYPYGSELDPSGNKQAVTTPNPKVAALKPGPLPSVTSVPVSLMSAAPPSSTPGSTVSATTEQSTTSLSESTTISAVQESTTAAAPHSNGDDIKDEGMTRTPIAGEPSNGKPSLQPSATASAIKVISFAPPGTHSSEPGSSVSTTTEQLAKSPSEISTTAVKKSTAAGHQLDGKIQGVTTRPSPASTTKSLSEAGVLDNGKPAPLPSDTGQQSTSKPTSPSAPSGGVISENIKPTPNLTSQDTKLTKSPPKICERRSLFPHRAFNMMLAMEIVAVIIWVEFALRFLVCPDKKFFFKSLLGLCDCIIIPLEITLYATNHVVELTDVMYQLYGDDYMKRCFTIIFKSNAVLVTVQLLRIFRLMGIATSIGEVQVLLLALSRSLREITLLAVVILLSCLLFGPIVFMVEYFVPSEGENLYFSIIDGWWWTIVTMTTVGYGDYYPVTWLGRVLAAIVMTTGMMMTALPVAIIGVNFSECYDYHIKRTAKQASGRAKQEKVIETLKSHSNGKVSSSERQTSI